jgi:hypothetical protein
LFLPGRLVKKLVLVVPLSQKSLKDVWSLAQAKGLLSLIYHDPVLEVRFMRAAVGTTRILPIRDDQQKIEQASPTR